MHSNPGITFVVSVTTLVLLFGSQALASYDSGPGYGVSHTPPVAVGHGQGWGSGHSAGSYYHYHVPLVGQQQHHYPAPQQQSNDHHLYYLLPLLLLAALPLLFLPLLPLLLLPLGLSLLGLLLPLLMMGGMMMMMMMDGGMMMMMMRNHGAPHRNSYNNGDSRGFSVGDLLLHDLNSLMGKYARSLDLDHCPERIVCEAGNFIFPDNATEAATARTIMNFLVEQAAPKGKARRLLRSYKQAFWSGSKSGNCSVYKCQPVFRIFPDSPLPAEAGAGDSFEARGYNSTGAGTSYTYSDYYNLYGQPNSSSSSSSSSSPSYYLSDPAAYFSSPLNMTSTPYDTSSASVSYNHRHQHPSSAFTSYYGSTDLNTNVNGNQQQHNSGTRKFKPKSKSNGSGGHFVSSQISYSSGSGSSSGSIHTLDNDIKQSKA